MFSICTKGIEDSLKRTEFGPSAVFASLAFQSGQDKKAIENAYLHNMVPSFSASSKSELMLVSKTSSIHLRTSLARAGVYLSSLIARKSLSRDETDAMACEIEDCWISTGYVVGLTIMQHLCCS